MTDGARRTIRRMHAKEWEQLRDIRLEMIEDTPTAYLESLQSARAQSDRQWQDRAAAAAAPGSVSLVADSLDDAGGAGSRLRAFTRVVVKIPQDRARPLQAMLISVYVAREHRGTGLADDLVGAAVKVARDELGAAVLQLGVHEDNARALAFYRRHGFTDTGIREPYPLDTSRAEIIMERELTPPGQD